MSSISHRWAAAYLRKSGTSSMGYRNSALPVRTGAFFRLSALVLTASSWVVSSQVLPQRVRDMSEAEQREFLIQSLDHGLPDQDIDQIGLLTLNRSDLVVPELLKRIELDVQNHSLPDRTIVL